MSLEQTYNLAFGAPVLRQRFIAARLKAAWDVRNEVGTTPNHANRRAWADSILADAEARADREYLIFLSNPTIRANGAASPDGDIEFVVNSFLNEYANTLAASAV
jgi:hypothetical protein